MVQDPNTYESVAIIQVNVPYLTDSDAVSYVRCRDVCNEIEWMGRRYKNFDDLARMSQDNNSKIHVTCYC